MHHAAPNAATETGMIAYDFLYCRGGAEYVTLALARNLPRASVCVDFRQPEAFPDAALEGIPLHQLGQPPRVRAAGWRTLRGMHQFHHRATLVAQPDWVVFSGANAPLAVRHRQRGRNLYYCHTPPRFAYDLYHWYLWQLPRWQRPAFRALSARVRHQYERALARMDVILANSANVQQRLHDHTGVCAEVVPPPCDTEGFRWSGSEGYYLSTARLEPYKRVDLLVAAFRRMPERRLIIASGGSEQARLQRMAEDAPNIEFTGWLSDAKMRELVGRATATLYMARDEDFGLSPVESMAAGKPVIATAEGGPLETVSHGQTGLLIPPDAGPEAIVNAVHQLPPEVAAGMRSECEQQARAFSTDQFLARMQAAIDRTRPGTD